jgi:holo-[acyl-carrier protein] synthase
MIIGLGVDIVETDRIARVWRRYGWSFAHKVLGPKEIDLFGPPYIPALAARFAGKEAAAKALGTGFSLGVTLKDLELINDSLGKPTLAFSGPARKRFDRLGARTCHVSLSHSRDNAVAMVILED